LSRSVLTFRKSLFTSNESLEPVGPNRTHAMFGRNLPLQSFKRYVSCIWRASQVSLRGLDHLSRLAGSRPKMSQPKKDSVDKILDDAVKEGRGVLTEPEAKRICSAYHIPTPPSRLVSNSKDAVDAARRLGFPVVLKIVSPDISHKTETGCVKLGLGTAAEVKHAFQDVMRNASNHAPRAVVKGVLVEKMLPKGNEVIIGGLKDPRFGQTLMFGLGGIFVELFEDVSFRVAPLSERAAMKMIREIKGYEILKGFRGQQRADEESLVKILLALSRLMIEHPEISQIDLNPTIVYNKGAVAVDARMSLAGQVTS